MANSKFSSSGMQFFKEARREAEASREQMRILQALAQNIQEDINQGNIDRNLITNLLRQCRLNGRMLSYALEILGRPNNQQERILYARDYSRLDT